MNISYDMNPPADVPRNLRHRCDAWLERRDQFLNMKALARLDGVLLNLRHDIYDPNRLSKPIQSMAMRALDCREEIIAGGDGTRRTFSDFARIHTPRNRLDSLPIEFDSP